MHAVRAAFEQANPELRFESRDLVADRRRGQMQLGGRERKTAPARHGFEGKQVGSCRYEGHGQHSNRR